MVLTPRRRRQVGERNFADDGDKKARSPGRSRRKPLKPFACGNAGCFGVSVVTNARAFYTPRAAAGALAPGIPHALTWAEDSGTTRALAPRECGRVFANAAKPSSPRTRGPITTGLNCCAKVVEQRLSTRATRRMDPRVRRDDKRGWAACAGTTGCGSSFIKTVC